MSGSCPASIACEAGLVVFDLIDSTNVEAARRYAGGERGPLWLWAKAQSSGRGRLAGRSWASPPGNLYSTHLTTLVAPARVLGQVSLVTALAVVDTLARLASQRLAISLKWPNDVLVGGRKVSGILVESLGGSDPAGWTLAIGCGINLAHAPAATRYPAAALADSGVVASPEEALGVYRVALGERLARWNGGRGFEAVRRDWLALGPEQGSLLRVDGGAAPLEGRFAGLGPGGELRLSVEGGGLVDVHAGDVEPAGHREARP